MDAHLPPKKTTKPKRNLISEILQKKKIKEDGLRVALTNIKKKYYLTSIDQAACFYIDKYNLDINVSDIIDHVTRQAIQNARTKTAIPSVTKPSVKKPASSTKTRKITVPIIKWMTDDYYSKAGLLSDSYGYFYIFENALKMKINDVMSVKYTNWWDTKIKVDLPDVDKYYEKEKASQGKLPMVGSPGTKQPVDYLTVGLLEKIVIKYQNEFIPLVFPDLAFFTGNMYYFKRVRNEVAHMSPDVTITDIKDAKHGINILLRHLSNK
jgi:hypothetical protein